MPVSVKQRKQLISELNPQQKDAVKLTLDDPSLVIAGAGSGKTKVLTTRIAYILSKGYDARSILAVTFTNKAAGEMRERVAKVVGEADAKRITIGTFHSLCVRWLHKYYAEAGLKKSWTILDDDDAHKVLKSVLKDFNMPSAAENVRAFKATISNLKNDMITPAKYRNQIQYSHEQDTYRVYAEYQDRMKRQNAVDFDDLLVKMVQVLENKNDPTVRKRFQRTFEWVMVDEYQDTNECQYRLIKRIVGKRNNLFIVGDDYQSIYGWRGANIQKILNFQKDYPGAQILKLEQNYRSTQTIVEAGNAIMDGAPNQMQKTCFSQKAVGDKIKVHEAYNDGDEASFVAQEIMNLVTFEGYKYADIAILYRTNAISRLFEEKFMFNMIPYNMVSGFSFYERKEIKDILSWLQLSVNPDNDIACERVMNTIPGLGKTTIEAMINQQKKTLADSLYSVVEIYKPKMVKTQVAIAGLTQTVVRLNTIYEAGKTLTDTPITDMMDLIFKHTGYLEKLQDSTKQEDEDRLMNVKELQKLAKGYEQETKKPNLQDFLDQIALASQSDKVKKNDDKVQMMTLHTAKGLEFKAVFFVGFEEGIMPHAMCKQPDEIAEERRLAYVGITRAEKLLYLTSARNRMDYSRNWQRKEQSQFLDLLPSHLLEDV